MADLIIYLQNHGYSESDSIYVSWLDANYYVRDIDEDSFKISSTDDDLNFVTFTTTVTTGYVREVDLAGGTTTISNLDHLEGETVKVVSGGEIVATEEVSGGEITISSDLYSYQVGLPYTMKIKTTRLELAQSPTTTQSKIKRITEVDIRYLKSVGGKAGQEYGGTEYLQNLDCEFSDKSKDVNRLNSGGFDPDAYLICKSEDPYPFTLIVFMAELDVTQ